MVENILMDVVPSNNTAVLNQSFNLLFSFVF